MKTNLVIMILLPLVMYLGGFHLPWWALPPVLEELATQRVHTPVTYDIDNPRHNGLSK